MKKEEVRKEFFKLKNKGFSYAQCKRILKAQLGYEVNIRTLKRWVKKLDGNTWDLADKSRRPHVIHLKVNPLIEKQVLSLRVKTGWGCDKLFANLPHLGIGMRTMKWSFATIIWRGLG